MDSSLAEQGCRQTQCGSNVPPLGFQLLAFSCVFPLECPLYDTLAHSTRAWLLVTQTHLPTRTLARSLCSLAYTWSACTCAFVLARFMLIHTERHDYANVCTSLVIWQGVTIDWVPRQGLPIKFSLQNSLVPWLTFKQRRDNFLVDEINAD